ncbi:hypothetical protein PR048_005309 [Dryococelus australis]|uniref:Reverse transcriptase domain-containing protein n=1 Tax=Dryococelus australis TaxID=614101 RepID=A0ABQ9I7V4_9NEOP|nr:hypothetical protein PR048_005309 [Dryococelus australis]
MVHRTSTQNDHTRTHYLTEISLVVTLDGVESETRPVTAGVPQGSTFSPLLYCIYMADILSTDPVKTLLFADDTLLYKTDKNLAISHNRTPNNNLTTCELCLQNGALK